MAQASTSALENVTLVQSLPTLAAGLGKDFSYEWNADQHRWEVRQQTSGDGATHNVLYWVQYLDSDGDPQESVAGAVRARHGLTGDRTYHYDYDGNVVDQEWDYDYEVEITGLGTPTVTMTGDGATDMSSARRADGETHRYRDEVGWSTDPSVSWPVAGGCPTGTIRNEIAPYYSLVVFDGSSTVVSTLYDANDDAVPGGQSTYMINCGTK